MHGLVTGEDPRHRRGDLEPAGEPTGLFRKRAFGGNQRTHGLQLGSAFFTACWDLPPLLAQPHRSRLSAYALEQSWVDKDPRLCLTYSAYLHIRRIPLVVALREPLAVAASLFARNGFSLNHGLVLWWVYNHHIASHMCSEDLLLLYSDLLAFDEQTMQQCLAPFLDIPSIQGIQASALIATLKVRTEPI